MWTAQVHLWKRRSYLYILDIIVVDVLQALVEVIVKHWSVIQDTADAV